MSNTFSKIFFFAIGSALALIASLMIGMFLLLLTNLVTIPVSASTEGVLLVMYLLGTIGISMMCRLAFKRFMAIREEEAYQAELTAFLRTCEPVMKESHITGEDLADYMFIKSIREKCE